MKRFSKVLGALAVATALFAATSCDMELRDSDSRVAELKKTYAEISELSTATWTLTNAAATSYGTWICLDSTDNGTAYNMTVESITVDGKELLSSSKNITTDAYLTTYAAAAASSDAGTKACAKAITVPSSGTTTVEYVISDITVTGVTPESWGVYNFGFSDITNSVYYAIRSDGWDNNLVDATTTGSWASGTYTDGANILLSSPYTAGCIKLSLTLGNGQAVLKVSSCSTTPTYVEQ